MFKLEINHTIIHVYTMRDLVKFGADQKNYIFLQDYTRAATDLFVSASITRGKLWSSACLDDRLIDFAIPHGYDTQGRRGVWYYGSSVYSEASNVGHFIPDYYAFKRIATFAMLHKNENKDY